MVKFSKSYVIRKLSAEDEKENTPESITLGKDEQKDIDVLARKPEDDFPDLAKVEDSDGRRNEDSHPKSTWSYILK